MGKKPWNFVHVFYQWPPKHTFQFHISHHMCAFTDFMFVMYLRVHLLSTKVTLTLPYLCELFNNCRHFFSFYAIFRAKTFYDLYFSFQHFPPNKKKKRGKIHFSFFNSNLHIFLWKTNFQIMKLWTNQFNPWVYDFVVLGDCLETPQSWPT